MVSCKEQGENVIASPPQLERKNRVEALGRHFLVELGECNIDILNDLRKIEDILVTAAKKAKATIVESRFHQFNPFGISGVVVIAESHLTIHTWPEHGYAAVDIFTCGKALEPTTATDYLIKKFQSRNPSMV
ncbi:MAG: adenosylmethionine decarboxylase, partial [Calditrichia bacterium]